MVKITRSRIGEFLSAKRVAVIGVSRQSREYSRMLFRELLKHGYDAIPVNPAAEELDGKACFKCVTDITPAPERAVILLPEEKTEQAVIDCANAGIRNVWLHRQVGHGVSDSRAIFQAEQHGMNLITGLCMFMFLPKASFIHKLHGCVMKIVGAYPK